MPRIRQASQGSLNIRRRLRAEMTSAEKALWLKLRYRQLHNLKFRRQHGVGPYIVDFYCAERTAVIEVDGDTHAHEEQIRHDKKRSLYLKSLGLKEFRYTNNDILENIEGVLEDLALNLACDLPPQPP